MVLKSPIFSFMIVILSLIIMSCDAGGKPDIAVKDSRFVPSRMMIGVASVFMLIENNGNGRDTLTGCSVTELKSARCELHDVLDGKMIKIEKVKIPAGTATELKKGVKHIMVFNLPEKIEGNIKMVLNFEKSGVIQVPANILLKNSK